ncbi:PREDICTED: uncharacterized protein LOC106811700 [Priapulus caudatus]|uniref:Uncharacterized protein LOC106811700 n=1 Tax=Priapulus caudatus TaxID=37621 RepID=A0ABM1EFB7_PRICU|nr:PREDICTED: uncharacterized protein LOC106811700 [Priapulus caudatus]
MVVTAHSRRVQIIRTAVAMPTHAIICCCWRRRRPQQLAGLLLLLFTCIAPNLVAVNGQATNSVVSRYGQTYSESYNAVSAPPMCEIPVLMRGQWYSYEGGGDKIHLLEAKAMSGKGTCIQMKFDDADSVYRNFFLFDNGVCKTCVALYYRTPNVLEKKETTCQRSDKRSTMKELCTEIDIDGLTLATMFMQAIYIVTKAKAYDSQRSFYIVALSVGHVESLVLDREVDSGPLTGQTVELHVPEVAEELELDYSPLEEDSPKVNHRTDKSFNPDRATICSRNFEESCFSTESMIILDVKPWEDETDLVEMEEAADRCVVGDDNDRGTDFLEETITHSEDHVSRSTIAAFNKL